MWQAARVTDSETEDTVSIYSEIDSPDDQRSTRGRRGESFHSNFSSGSGSAHLFEFETNSLTTEYDEVFDDQKSGGKTFCKNHKTFLLTHTFSQLQKALVRTTF